MPRTRISTTVDPELLGRARRARKWPNDATLFDAALASLVAAERATEIDERYASGYERHPIDESDGFGDFAAWRDAAGRK